MRKLVILLILCFPFTLPAQKQGQDLLDSLLKELPKMKEDTNKLDALQQISHTYRVINPDKGIIYGEKCLELAKKVKQEKWIANCHNCLGNNYKAKSDFPNALKQYHAGRTIYENLGIKKNEAIMLMNIGTVYRALQKSDEAMKYYELAYNLAIETKNKQLQGQLLGNKGVIYFEREDFVKQREVNEKALKIFEDLNDLGNTAWIISNTADGYAIDKNFEKALEYQNRAIFLYEKLGDILGIAISYENIGSVYFNLAVEEKNNTKKNEYLDLSVSFFLKAEAIQKELGLPDYLKNVYLNLSSTYELKGDAESALKSYQSYITLKDSVHSLEVQESIANLETKRELEVRDKEIVIQQLKKRTERIYLGGGIGLLLLIIIFVVAGYRRQKKSNVLLNVEKQKSDDLLHNILPEEVAAELKLKGNADATLFEQVTVLFTDFKGFTTIAERLSPKELVAEIDECFRAFDAIMERHNIEKIKTIGDAYMAAGGLPVVNLTNAGDVVNAALEIQYFMEALKIKKTAEGKECFAIRIGVHTGPVVAGIVGIKKFAYDIWGDTVNTASRMESSGEPGKVNISGTTYEIVKENFVCSHRGKIPAKNKGEIDMYFVEGKVAKP